MKRRTIPAALAVSALLLASCGDDQAQQDPNAGSSTAPRSSQLSASAFERLVVDPGPPFRQVPDEELRSGLMEIGAEGAGTIGLGFAGEADVAREGFQRGWEKIFRAPGGLALTISVFGFRNADGPVALVELFELRQPDGYTPVAPVGHPDARGVVGTSPEGGNVIAFAEAHDRFLVSVIAGGFESVSGGVAVTTRLLDAQIAQLRV